MTMPKKKKQKYPRFINLVTTIDTTDVMDKMWDEFSTVEMVEFLKELDLRYQDWDHTLQVFTMMANSVLSGCSELLEDDEEDNTPTDTHSILGDVEASVEELYYRLVERRPETVYDDLERFIMRDAL